VAYGNGHLYAGSESGQVWEIGATPRLVTANAGMVADLTVGRDGLYVAAFSGTISRIDPATGIVRVLTSDRYDPNAVQVSANGLVYFATGGVLQSVDPATGSVSSDLHVGADDDVWDFSLGATSVVLERDTLWAVTGL
jgi:streptogramin lyase